MTIAELREPGRARRRLDAAARRTWAGPRCPLERRATRRRSRIPYRSRAQCPWRGRGHRPGRAFRSDRDACHHPLRIAHGRPIAVGRIGGREVAATGKPPPPGVRRPLGRVRKAASHPHRLGAPRAFRTAERARCGVSGYWDRCRGAGARDGEGVAGTQCGRHRPVARRACPGARQRVCRRLRGSHHAAGRPRRGHCRDEHLRPRLRAERLHPRARSRSCRRTRCRRPPPRRVVIACDGGFRPSKRFPPPWYAFASRRGAARTSPTAPPKRCLPVATSPTSGVSGAAPACRSALSPAAEHRTAGKRPDHAASHPVI